MNPNFDTKRRKWFLQMTPQEIYALRGAVIKHVTWSFSAHALDEMRADRVTTADVQKVLQYGKVMEAHNCDPNDLCVLLRFTVGRRSIAAVVSLCRGEVVTVFANTIESGMRKPDMTNYKWTATLDFIKHVTPANLDRVK